MAPRDSACTEPAARCGKAPRVAAGGYWQARTAAGSPKASRRAQSTERRRRRASIWFLVMRPTPSSPAEGGVIARSSHARTLRVDMRCSIGHAHGEPSRFLLIRRTPGEKLMSPAHFQRRASGQVAAGTHTLCNEPREDTMREQQRAGITFFACGQLREARCEKAPRVAAGSRNASRHAQAKGGGDKYFYASAVFANAQTSETRLCEAANERHNTPLH